MVQAWLMPATRDEIKSEHIRQYGEFLSGALDQQATLTGYTGTGVAVKIRAEDPAATPIQVRNAGDTATLFEVHNTLGTILGGLQPGSAGAPSLAFLTEPTSGLYLAGPDQLGLATGDPTASTLKTGAGGVTEGPVSDGIVAVYQGGAGASTTIVSKPGISLRQGDGTALVNNVNLVVGEDDIARGYGAPPLDVRAYHDTTPTPDWGHIAGTVLSHALKGQGGFVTGFNVSALVGGTFGRNADGTPASGTKAVIGSRVVAEGGHITNGGVRSVTPFLITSRGYNDGDQLQGIELTLATNRADTGPATTPSQRLGIIITTEDNGWSKAAGAADAHIMLSRKGRPIVPPTDPVTFDQTHVEPFKNGILLGDAAGDEEAWPFDGNSSLIHADPLLPAHGTYNALGAVVNMENTRVANYYIRGGVGNSLHLFDFTRLDNLSGSILNVAVAGATKLNVLGSGWVGIGTTPVVPIHIHDDTASLAMAFRGTSILSSTALTVPGAAVRRLLVSYWNGSAYSAGWLPIFA